MLSSSAFRYLENEHKYLILLNNSCQQRGSHPRVLSFPIPLRSLFAVHPELLAPVLRVIQRVITTHLIQQAGIERTHAATLSRKKALCM